MRLFYGLSLPPEIRAITGELAALAGVHVPGRYAPMENHHITLAFLGEVAPERLPEAEAVLARCAGAFPAPRVRIEGFSYFNRMENAILTLSASSAPALEPLNAALREALAREGLPFDPGPFSPHVTLARHAHLTPQSLSALNAQAPAACFTAECACLFLSARDTQNALRYTPIFSAPWKNPPFETEL